MTRPLEVLLAERTIVLLDGAVGTELERRGVHTTLPLWSALGLIEAPQVVRAIHDDYAAAGADVLVTNTFRTTSRTLGRAGYGRDDVVKLNRLAVGLARAAADASGRSLLVAGSIAPLEDCYSPQLSPPFEIALEEHREQAELLAEAGVDFIMVETMPLIAEAEAAVLAAMATDLEVTVGFVLGDDGRLLSGESLETAVDRLARHPIAAVLVNCAPVATISAAMPRLRDLADVPIGGYANMGDVESTVGWTPDQSVSALDYASAAADWMLAGASIVGGCCGTEPKHIAGLRRLTDRWLTVRAAASNGLSGVG